MKTCATCKHCIWMPKRSKKGVIQTMSCAEFTSGEMIVVCDPPYDGACSKYEEVEM